jgi:hypothetical protein
MRALGGSMNYQRDGLDAGFALRVFGLALIVIALLSMLYEGAAYEQSWNIILGFTGAIMTLVGIAITR